MRICICSIGKRFAEFAFINGSIGRVCTTDYWLASHVRLSETIRLKDMGWES